MSKESSSKDLLWLLKVTRDRDRVFVNINKREDELNIKANLLLSHNELLN